MPTSKRKFARRFASFMIFMIAYIHEFTILASCRGAGGGCEPSFGTWAFAI